MRSHLERTASTQASTSSREVVSQRNAIASPPAASISPATVLHFDNVRPATAMRAAIRGKVAVAELSEQALLRLTRVVGGGSFSASSPFASWFEDVRALGFLRPPWGLAVGGLIAASA